MISLLRLIEYPMIGAIYKTDIVKSTICRVTKVENDIVEYSYVNTHGGYCRPLNVFNKLFILVVSE